MKSLLTKIISLLTIAIICVSLCACKSKTNTEPNCNGDHIWELTSTTATCYEEGVEIFTCKNCKKTKIETVKAYGHDLVITSHTEPTCKTNGEEVKKCSRCSFESKQTLLMVDHDYQVKSTTPSTCTMHGSKNYECTMCHETKTEILELKEHVYELTQTTPSTCAIKGSNTYKCKNCSDTYLEEIDILEHDYKLINETPSTCAVKGSMDYECSVCHDTYSNELPLEEHKYELISLTPSTCVKHGTKNYGCPVCHNTYSDELPLADHEYETVEIISTCFTHGATKEQCSVCQDEKNIKETPLLAHNFGADGYCTNCGINEHYFNTNLNVRWQFGTLLGDLTPLFNNDNQDTVEHRNSHTINIKLICYDQSTAYTFSYDSKTNVNNVFFSLADGVENMDIPCHFMINIGNLKNYLKTYTIEISCDGFKTILNSYTYR